MSSKLGQQLADIIIEKYKKLPKTGKPQKHEYTCLTGIVLESPSDVQQAEQGGSGKCFQSIVLCTGLKCVSGDRRDKAGRQIADSHSEILVRRGLILWVNQQLKLGSKSRYFDVGYAADNGGHYHAQVKAGVEFHMIMTWHPCGDCSIVRDDKIGEYMRTGAKPVQLQWLKQEDPLAVPDSEQQTRQPQFRIPQESDVERGPQQIGVLRRKPGKGSATCSMSCSDKLAKYQLLGMQGSLLGSILRKPLSLRSITICQNNTGSEQSQWDAIDESRAEAVRRGVSGRATALRDTLDPSHLPFPDIEVHVARMEKSDCEQLPFHQSTDRVVSCNMCINWIDGSDAPNGVEVVLGSSGYMAGSGNRAPSQRKDWSRLCRTKLAEDHIELINVLHSLYKSQGDTGQDCVGQTTGIQQLKAYIQNVNTISAADSILKRKRQNDESQQINSQRVKQQDNGQNEEADQAVDAGLSDNSNGPGYIQNMNDDKQQQSCKQSASNILARLDEIFERYQQAKYAINPDTRQQWDKLCSVPGSVFADWITRNIS